MDTDKLSINAATKGISGSTIKLIAIVTMLIDHIGAVVVERMIGYSTSGDTAVLTAVYYSMRLIGRMGFPIFIFLLVQGVEHTRSKWKYLLRLMAFALISEIPFDFAFGLSVQQIAAGKFLEFSYQNVFFTLSIGLLCILGLQEIDKIEWNAIIKIVLSIGVVIAGMILAEWLRTDYGDIGVLAIVVMYLFRRTPLLAAAGTCVILLFSNILEISAFFVLLPLAFYNGKRGWKLKWVFYLFYPVHLFVLWLICLGMGIA